MSKLMMVTALTAAAFSVAACGRAEENNMAVENIEDLNATDDMNMDIGNMDMNMDMNATDNAVDNATDNAAANDSADNSANSY